jgi:crotonobetainyl-CoA:carnitine CoA-transferase CaiB-like acyl-CoA transferase
MSNGSLDGVRVIDLSRVLGGPYCTQILADHGAEVIKLEPPQGDDTRSWGPPFIDDVAAYFSGVNRNKQGLVVNLATDNGRDLLFELLAEADVLVENFKPGTLERWGMGYADTLAERFPRLIHCAITGFGESGPLGRLPGYDAIIQAMAGLMSVNGTQESGPTRIGVPIVDMVTGMNAALGILMALHERTSSGRGQSLDMSLYDSGISFLHPHMANFFANGALPRLTGNAHPNIAPYATYATADEPIYLAVGNNRQFAKLCELLSVPELTDDPRFIDNAARCGHRAELRKTLEAQLVAHNCKPLAEQLIHAGVPAGPVQDVATVAADPHTRHRQMVVGIDEYRGVASPIKLSRTPATYRKPPPALGGNSREILSRLGIDDATQEQLLTAGIIKQE